VAGPPSAAWIGKIQAAGETGGGGRKRCLKNMSVLEIDTQKTWMKFEFLKPELSYTCNGFLGCVCNGVFLVDIWRLTQATRNLTFGYGGYLRYICRLIFRIQVKVS